MRTINEIIDFKLWFWKKKKKFEMKKKVMIVIISFYFKICYLLIIFY